jgi:hypothetical protein
VPVAAHLQFEKFADCIDRSPARFRGLACGLLPGGLVKRGGELGARDKPGVDQRDGERQQRIDHPDNGVGMNRPPAAAERQHYGLHPLR